MLACILLATLAPISCGTEQAARRRAEGAQHNDIDIDEILEDNMRLLREDFYRVAGRELTDQEMADAMSKAMQEQLPGLFRDGKLSRSRGLKNGILGSEDERRRMREQGIRQVQQVPSGGTYIMVTGQSPGWSYNYGRNEFYCLAMVWERMGMQRLPPRKSPFTIKDCLERRAEEIVMAYTSQGDLILDELSDVFWNWCVSSPGPNITENATALMVDHCDVTNPLQTWTLLSGDNTMRPNADPLLCVTANPPISGKVGGVRRRLGKKKRKKRRRRRHWKQSQNYFNAATTAAAEPIFRQCSTDEDERPQQIFVACRLTGSCRVVDLGGSSTYVECDISAACEN